MPRSLRIVHTVPENDVIEHNLHMKCPCGPQHDPQAPNLTIHNALDGRVAVEQAHELLGIPYADPDRTWANYIITIPL